MPPVSARTPPESIYSYHAHGVTIGFPVAVTGLVPAEGIPAPDIALNWLGLRKPENMPSVIDVGWSAAALTDAAQSYKGPKLWRRESGHGTEYLLRFGNVHTAEFIVNADRHIVDVAWTNPQVDPENLVKLMLGPVLGLMQRYAEELLLHASAVVTEHGAVAFVGASGSGKSTLVASLLAQQCRLLSDDLVLLKETNDEFVLHPGHALIRLWPSSVAGLDLVDSDLPRVFPSTRKQALAVDTECRSDPVPLKAIFMLSSQRNPDVVAPLSRLTPAESLSLLLDQMYPPFLPVASHERPRLFARFAHLVSRIPVYRYNRSDGFAELPAISRQIIAMVEND